MEPETMNPEETLYFCEGHKRMLRERSWSKDSLLVLVDDDGKAPVLLDLRGDMRKYFLEVYSSLSKEKDMRKRFYYDRWCEVRKIVVLDEAGNAVKTVRPGQDWRPFIGEEEYLA